MNEELKNMDIVTFSKNVEVTVTSIGGKNKRFQVQDTGKLEGFGLSKRYYKNNDESDVVHCKKTAIWQAFLDYQKGDVKP